jgi:hypothetical protein
MLLRKRFASAPSDQRVLFQNPVQNSHHDKAVLALSLEERLHVRKLILQNPDPRGRALAGGGVGLDVPTLSSSDVVNASWAPVNITPVNCAGPGCETQWRGSVIISHDRRVSRVNHSR